MNEERRDAIMAEIERYGQAMRELGQGEARLNGPKVISATEKSSLILKEIRAVLRGWVTRDE